MGEIGDHHRDIKQHKKQHKQKHLKQKHQKEQQKRESPPRSHRRCWDWMLVSGNVHYAKNRAAFTSYRRAPGKIGHMRVLGVGTVQLQVRRAPEDERTGTMVLNDVMHFPDALCNGVCINKHLRENPQEDLTSWKTFQVEDRNNGEPLWYGKDYCGLGRLVLAGDPQGETYLSEDQGYLLSVHASEADLEKLHRRVDSASL